MMKIDKNVATKFVFDKEYIFQYNKVATEATLTFKILDSIHNFDIFVNQCYLPLG